MIRLSCAPILVLALALVPACGKSDDAALAVNAEAQAQVVGAEAAMVVSADLGSDAVVEEHDDGTVAWAVAPDGQVRAVVTASAGGQIKEDVSGSLVYKLEDGEPKTVPLVLEPKTGVLVAAGPKLEADLTEVDYTLQVAGKPWTGVMHVPVGGTAAIATTAKTSADVKIDAEAVGPHGGTIQVVGDDRLEMVSDDNGEVRVYVLDADLRPRTSIEGRTLRVGFIAEHPELVTFTHASGGAYFVGRFGTRAVVDPLRVTVSLGLGGGVVRSAIWGYRPGIRIVAPTAKVRIAAAPRVHFRLTGGFDSHVDVYGRTRVVHDHDHHHHHDHDHDDHHHHRKGDNGRHFGQDGTFARDSGGFKSDHAVHHHESGRISGGKSDSRHSSGGSKGGGGSAKGGGGGPKGGGGGAKGGGGGAKGGGGKGGKR